MLGPFAHPKGYVCHRAVSPVKVDGDLTDAAWQGVPWTDTFVDIEGDKQPRPRFRTRAKMVWDDEALYIAAELEDPHIWATLSEHDAVIFQDNDFEVFLDPDGDNHLYAELELNATNTTWDLLLSKPYKDQGRAINNWEIKGLKTGVKLDGTINNPADRDTGWTLEICWPWSGLKELAITNIPPQDGDRWRINFSRVQWDLEVAEGKYRKVKGKPEYNWVWSPQGVIDMHRPERWGYLQFSTAKPGKAEFSPDPDWEARDLLHRVYYAQHVHQKATGKYATAIGDLQVKDKAASRISLETTRRWFEASVLIPGEKGTEPRRITISQDSQIVKE